MLLLLLALPLCVAVQLGTLAHVARRFGLPLREFTFGMGPTLLHRGRFRWRLLPLGGSVAFVEPKGPGSGLDALPPAVQLLICLSGCWVLLAVAAVLAGAPLAWAAFITTPGQWLAGALSPWQDAQPLLRSAARLAHEAPAPVVVGTVAAKLAALNLLPLAALNGGAAVRVLARAAGLDRWWPPSFTVLSALVWLGSLLLWAAAIVGFASAA